MNNILRRVLSLAICLLLLLGAIPAGGVYGHVHGNPFQPIEHHDHDADDHGHGAEVEHHDDISTLCVDAIDLMLSLISIPVSAAYEDGVECDYCGSWRYDDWKCDNGDHCGEGSGTSCYEEHHCGYCGACDDDHEMCDDCGNCLEDHCECDDKCRGCYSTSGTVCSECGEKCSECAEWMCDDCEKCPECAGDELHCSVCDICLNCAEWICYCGDGCSRCTEGCPECNERCLNCAEDELCQDCGVCFTCAGGEGNYCTECLLCKNCVDQLCACGRGCSECTLVCESCGEQCEECADGGICEDCGICFTCVGGDGNYCIQCDKCKFCVDYICVGCGEGCSECSVVCPECNAVCENCGDDRLCGSCDVCFDCVGGEGNYCSECGECKNCVDQVCICGGGCSQCAYVCPECGEKCTACAEDQLCTECGVCFDCAGGNYCSECWLCDNCVDQVCYCGKGCSNCSVICTECGEKCENCADDMLCGECGLCFDCVGGDYCAECGECIECVEYLCACGNGCNQCAEVVCEECNEKCSNCAPDELCQDCGLCFACVGGEGNYCENCGICKFCVDYICLSCGSGCSNCVDVICEECGEKCSNCANEELCTECGICRECAGGEGHFCDNCSVCKNCVDYICYCGQGCSLCATICPDCGEKCDQCSDGEICVDCGFCDSCVGDGNFCHECALCITCVGMTCSCGNGCTNCQVVCEKCCEVCSACSDELCEDCGTCMDCAGAEAFCSVCHLCSECTVTCVCGDGCENCADICPDCGEKCSACFDEFCASCDLCRECADDMWCEDCMQCGECTEVCEDCGIICRDCAENICEDCGKCSGCMDEFCPDCGICIDCADEMCRDCHYCGNCVDNICPDCGEICADCEQLCVVCNKCDGCGDTCPDCDMCSDCCAESSEEEYGCTHGICSESSQWSKHYCTEGQHCVGGSAKTEYDSKVHWTECGESCNVRLNEENHTFGSGKITKEATKKADGVISFSCTECGFKKEESIPKLTSGHTHAYTVTVVEPTCSAGGYTTHSCSCGHSYTDSVVSAVKHEYKSVHTDSEHWQECIYCGSATERSSHKLGGWTTVTKPGYTFKGEKQQKCKLCDYAVKESIPMLTVPGDKLVVVIPDYDKYAPLLPDKTVKVEDSESSGNNAPDTPVAPSVEGDKPSTEAPVTDNDAPKGDGATVTPTPEDKKPSGSVSTIPSTKELLTKGDGQSVPALPTLPPKDEGNTFDGWRNKATGEVVKKGDKLTENIEIEPVWKDCGEDSHKDENGDNCCDECGYILIKEEPVPPVETPVDTVTPEQPSNGTTDEEKPLDEQSDKKGNTLTVIAISSLVALIAACGGVTLVALKKKKK